MTDDEYVARGKHSNSDQLSIDDASELFDALRDEECLEDVLEVPFSLHHIKDIHAAMQVALARVGEENDDITRHQVFCVIFSAFVLGFAISLVTARRAQHTGQRLGLGRTAKRDPDACEAWGIEVALYYLVSVERCGIIDPDTDAAAYGIQPRWRQIADERRLNQFDALPRCVAAGKEAAAEWAKDDMYDVGFLLVRSATSLLATLPADTIALAIEQAKNA